MCDFSCRPETSLSRSSSLYGIRSLGDISPWYSHLVSVLGFRSRGPVSNPSRGHCAVVLGKALACKTCVTFLSISGEQGRKRAEREARIECEGRSAPLLTRSSRSPLFFWNTQKITSVLQASKVVTLAVPLSTQMCEWVPANLMLGVALWWTSVSTRASREIEMLVDFEFRSKCLIRRTYLLL